MNAQNSPKTFSAIQRVTKRKRKKKDTLQLLAKPTYIKLK